MNGSRQVYKRLWSAHTNKRYTHLAVFTHTKLWAHCKNPPNKCQRQIFNGNFLTNPTKFYRARADFPATPSHGKHK